jgi:hypothetical protein
MFSAQFLVEEKRKNNAYSCAPFHKNKKNADAFASRGVLFAAAYACSLRWTLLSA